MRRYIFAITTVLIIVFAIYIIVFYPKTASFNGYALDTDISITASGLNPSKALNIASSHISELDLAFNRFDKNSELYNINETAFTKPVLMSKQMQYIISKSIDYYNLTKGSFDITIEPLMNAWGINSPNARIPSDVELQGILPLVASSNINVENENSTIKFKKNGMGLDLGAIAKGYALDETVNILRQNNISSACVNLGGCVAVIGKNNGEYWKIGVQDPVSSDYFAKLLLSDKAISTSGQYIRNFVSNGKTYGHILDPKTGKPANTDILSVSIIANEGIVTDAMSTAVFVMGSTKGLSLINSLDGIDAIVVTKDNNVYLTNGIKDKFELVNKKYTLVK